MNEGFFDSYEISTVGKVFLAAAAAAILGRITNIRIRGTQDEIDALRSALMASRQFQDELRRPGATVQSIMDRLHIKNMTAQEFEDRLGVPFPL